MIATTALRESLAQTYADWAAYASLHTSDPGTTGAGELTSVPRLQLTWTGGTVDGVVSSGVVTFNVPGGTNVTHVGIWSAATGGNFLDAVASSIAFDTQGQYEVSLVFTQS